RNCISLLEPHDPGRRVSVWRGQQTRVVGESPEALHRWLPRWGAKKGKSRGYQLHDGVLIWLPEPLVPAEYPRTAADVRALARERSPEAVDVLEGLASSGADEIDVVLGARTPNGACFAAVTVRPPRQTGAPRRKGNLLVKGFRPSHVPRGLLVDRYLSGAAKVTKATVKRADHLWIHGRDQDPRQERLRQARVAILGCGSVGGPLARLLAQAGIGNLLLVDPGTMDWPNVGRHELGAGSVSRFKAPELVREIEKAYPHLGEVRWRRERVGPDAQGLMGELASYDLIVSTMGSWPAESFLNDMQQETDGFPPVLYGWVEPNAAAAHALLIRRSEACLRCGMNDKGRPHLTVTDWPNDGPSLQEPACGALFTPYGPAELCWAHALLSETVIEALTGEASATRHSIWIGPRSRVEAAGGTWAADWIAEIGDPGAGGMTAERSWPASASCPVCARRVRAA
ncbi:MAG: ThiF family adenylyltransferase, partial [bacterium]